MARAPRANRPKLNEHMATFLLAIQAALIAAPLTLFFAIQVRSDIEYLPEILALVEKPSDVPWGDIANAILLAISAVALVAGWWMLISRLFGGREALRKVRGEVWVCSWIGVVIIASAWFSGRFPLVEDYSQWGTFRQRLGLYFFASPLVLPFFHLWYERRVAPSGDPHDQSPPPKG